MKNTFILLCLLMVSCFTSFAQVKTDTIYITYSRGEKETAKSKATYFRVRKYSDTLYAAEYRIKDSSLANEGYYKSFQPSVREGAYTQYTDDGKYVFSRGQYQDNKKTGEWMYYFYASNRVWYKIQYVDGKYDALVSYYPTGEIKRSVQYTNGQFKRGKCFTRTGADTTYYALYVYPVFSGGNDQFVRYVKKHLIYPKEAKEHELAGEVNVLFTVKKDGSLVNVRIDPDWCSYYMLNEAAVELVRNMPKWTPGYVDGIADDFQYSVQIYFTAEQK